MMSIKRYGSAIAAAAAFAAMTVAAAPAATAVSTVSRPAVEHQRDAGPMVTGRCAVLTAQFTAQLQAAATALAATAPDIVTAQTAVSAAQGTNAQLQARYCLPSVDVVLAAQLAHNLQELYVTLNSSEPNIADADAAVDVLLDTSVAADLKVRL